MFKRKSKIELNDQFKDVLRRLEETTDSLLITGNAGTGKSTLLTEFQKRTKKKVAVLAPTGVAALNVKGQTIHSFFGFPVGISADKLRHLKPSTQLKELLENLDVLVIDEISMVRADLLDYVDHALRRFREINQPFGGLQMLMIGDLHQLPPVVTKAEEAKFEQSSYGSPYFFAAKAFRQFSLELIELTKIYRQQERDFVDILNKVRHGEVDYDHLEILNDRLIDDPLEFHQSDHGYITLTTTNKLAEQINQLHLERLGDEPRRYTGEFKGEFPQQSPPTQIELELKEGAQVMLLNNDPQGRWVNGSIGQINEIKFDLESGVDILHIYLADEDREVKVKPHAWELNRYVWNAEDQQLDKEEIGSFKQYPVRLAWAITIHKSQGKTFSKVIVDLGRGAFAHGQVYVALSRCTSLSGLLLQRRISERDIFVDPKVKEFTTLVAA